MWLGARPPDLEIRSHSMDIVFVVLGLALFGLFAYYAKLLRGV
jgi:hypothetical protein